MNESKVKFSGDFSELESIVAARRRGCFTTAQGRVSVVRFLDKSLLFSVKLPRDVIQKCYLRGEIYEVPELMIMQRFFPRGGVMLDVGANVGNHGLFAAAYLGASCVVPIEPNPVAYKVLIENVFMNRLEGQFDLRLLGYGLTDVHAQGAGISFHERNVGSGRIVEGSGEIELLRGDDVFAETQVDFIKIDVEGMEITVLQGLEETIARARPPMFVEVENKNAEAFVELMDKWGYKTVDRYRRYRVNENFMVVHESRL